MRATYLMALGFLTAAATAALAQPMGMPARRGGEWRTTMSGMGDRAGSMTMKMCVDPATERSFSPFRGPYAHGGGGEEPTCSKRDVHQIPGGWAFESVCGNRQGGTTETSGRVTGDFQTHIHMVLDTNRGQGVHHMEMDQTWLGPCPAGGEGRTVTLPDGRTITIPSH